MNALPTEIAVVSVVKGPGKGIVLRLMGKHQVIAEAKTENTNIKFGAGF
jgi:hypothetical protein